MQVTDADLIRLREQNKSSPGNELNKYIKKDGRASVIITPTETGYDIRADCDSLQRVVFEYERAINTVWDEYSKLEQRIRDGPTLWDKITYILIGIGIGIITGIITGIIIGIRYGKNRRN